MMQLTRTFGPYSFEKATVIAFSPALAAEYGAVVAEGRIEETDETLIIAPPAPAFIFDPNSAESRNGPFRLTAITLSNRSSVCSTNEGYKGDSPALLISTSQRPHFT